MSRVLVALALSLVAHGAAALALAAIIPHVLWLPALFIDLTRDDVREAAGGATSGPGSSENGVASAGPRGARGSADRSPIASGPAREERRPSAPIARAPRVVTTPPVDAAARAAPRVLEPPRAHAPAPPPPERTAPSAEHETTPPAPEGRDRVVTDGNAALADSSRASAAQSAFPAGANGGDSPASATPTAPGGVGTPGAGGPTESRAGGPDRSGDVALAVPGEGGGGAAEYAGYLALVRERIHEALRYPSPARRRGVSGTVEVELLIRPSGAIADVAVVKSSSHPVLDDAAVDAVRSLGRVPFPPGVAPRTVRARLPIVFDLR